jgi:hypothetical protein
VAQSAGASPAPTFVAVRHRKKHVIGIERMIGMRLARPPALSI